MKKLKLIRDEELKKRSERIVTLFFKYNDVRFNPLLDNIVRELRQLQSELKFLNEELEHIVIEGD